MKPKKIIDLTQLFTEGMPLYPDTEPPSFKRIASCDTEGFNETQIYMTSHTGTHMDAPAHLFDHRTTLDGFPVSQFAGPALVIDCSDLGADARIPFSRIKALRPLADEAEFLLFYTGWDKKWGTENYYQHYPCLSCEAADYLICSGKKGIGLDTPGLDPVEDETLTLHKKLLSNTEIIIIENLCHLQEAGSGLFFFAALPLHYRRADGAPVRAVAVLD